MPIHKVLLTPAPGVLKVHCPLCGQVRDLPLDTVQLGMAHSPDCIDISACGTCGSTETYFRRFDICPPVAVGTFHDLHRRAVNSLSQYLKGKGQSHPAQQAAHAAEKTAPPDLVDIDKINLPLSPTPER